MTGYSDQAKMTRNLADADKPRDALRSVKVTKHGTNRHVKYATITFSLVRSVFWDIRRDLETQVRGHKVIGIDMDRSAAYNFLLTFHSNQGPISYRFRDKRWCRSKIAKFSHPYVFCAPAEGRFPLELGTGAEGQKTRMMGLQGRERSLMISSAVWIQYTNMTDGHRATTKTALTHSIAR